MSASSFQPKRARIGSNGFQQQPLSLIKLDEETKCVRTILEFLNLRDLACISRAHSKIHRIVSSVLSDNRNSLSEIVKKVFFQVLGLSDSTSQKLRTILRQTHQEIAQFGWKKTPKNPMDLTVENINAFFDARVQLAEKEIHFADLLCKQFSALASVCGKILDENSDFIQKASTLRTAVTRWQASKLEEVRKIKALSLPDEEITSLPMYIGGFSHLTHINLSDNSLRSLPTSFSRLTQLQRLDLSKNLFQIFPICICQLSLETLFLNGNELEYVPDDVQTLSKLRTLHLSDNRLKSLSAKIFEIFTLKNLYIQSNEPSLDGFVQQLIQEQPSLAKKISELFPDFGRLYIYDLSSQTANLIDKND